jgi:putative ABC transport system permease protein
MKFLRLVFKNVFRKKTRTLLTMGSIVLVLVLTVVLTSLLATLERENSEGKGGTRIFVQHASGLGYFLPLSHRQKIEPIPGVLAVTPEVWFGGTYIDQRPQNFFGQLSTDPETWKTIFDDFSIDPAQLTAWQSHRDSFIAGQQLIERYHWKIGDRIQLMGSYIPLNLSLVLAGTYRGPDESTIFFHNKYLENSWIARLGQTGTFVLRVTRPEDVGRVTEAIDAYFNNSSAPVKAMPEKQFQLQFVEMLGNVKLLIRSILLAVLFTVVLITANTMAMSARERVTEIAVIRALGFRPRDVLWLVLAESVTLALLGGVVGVFLSFPFTRLLVEALKRSPAAIFAYNFRVPASSIATAFIAAVVIGTVSGFVPAIRAARLSVVTALRQVA